ncbi:unnamed protein product [Calypogeia fissa]
MGRGLPFSPLAFLPSPSRTPLHVSSSPPLALPEFPVPLREGGEAQRGVEGGGAGTRTGYWPSPARARVGGLTRAGLGGENLKRAGGGGMAPGVGWLLARDSCSCPSRRAHKGGAGIGKGEGLDGSSHGAGIGEGERLDWTAALRERGAGKGEGGQDETTALLQY